MAAYYNEHDAFAAAWLRELIREGLIADGEVDERSIVDVRAGDLRGFTQCHFFAGIGGWSLALRLAGWPDDRDVWSGSCPCQPFSQAGKGRGKEDARHLWPQFRRLIRQCRPAVVFGEQVASAAGRSWLSSVFADVEALVYRAAGADLCAAGVGAWQIRQRLYWVADSLPAGRAERRSEPGDRQVARRGSVDRVADDSGEGLEVGTRQRRLQRRAVGAHAGQAIVGSGDVGWLENSNCERREELGLQLQPGEPRQALSETTWRSETVWSDVEWLTCADGKQRPTQPGIFPLAHGVSGRVGQLRGYGNAIVPQAAASFIAAYMDVSEVEKLQKRWSA